jgi:hypothetical protein
VTSRLTNLPSSEIEILPVSSKSEMERFISLAPRLQRNDPNYIAPLNIERREALSPKHNPLFEHMDAQFWLARSKGRDVGRISAQIERRALALYKEPTGYFGLIAAENDPHVFHALMHTAEDWLRERGMKHIHGPFNLSINEEVGLLVKGFETPPMLLMGHDLPYVAERLEEQGYAKEKDVFAYIYDTVSDIPEKVRRLIDRPLPANLTLRTVDFSRLREEIGAITEIFNDAWADNWGFVPLSEAETDHLARSMKPLLDKRLVWLVEIAGEPAGFLVCLPNLNEATRDLGGSLLPFGWAKLLWRLKIRGVKTARVPLMGIKRKFASGLIGGVLPFLLIEAARKAAASLGYQKIELSWILEDNMPMRRINEVCGGDAYKTYRIFGKALT